jgi:hypothetical protein
MHHFKILQCILWGLSATIIALIMMISYLRNDQIYHVLRVPKAEYTLFLQHEDLKSALPPGISAQYIRNGLRIFENTYWSYEIDFPQSGSVTVHMTAKGSPVQGVYPRVTLKLDREPPVILNIDTPKWKTFQKIFPLSAGKHIMTVAFENDAFRYPEDRNLDIQSLCIGKAEDCRSFRQKKLKGQ